MVRRVLAIELGMSREDNLVREAMRRGDAIPEDYTCDEAALNPFAVLYGHITAVDECVLLGVSGIIAAATSK